MIESDAESAAALPAQTATAAAPPPARNALALGDCANCGTPLLGEHCYRCGQPIKGMIRPLSGLIADLLDSLLSFDSRTFRTLLPLYFQPGFLTAEYLAGRRVRYVTPIRLFFFLSVIAFLAVSLIAERPRIDTGPELPIQHSTALPDAAPAKSPGAAASASKEPGVGFDSDGEERMQFNDRPWDAKTNPVRIEALPDWLNGALNDEIGRIKPKLHRIKQDPGLLIDKIFSLAPQTLMVILPIFALLLKFFYLFKRRYYSEHLIVALHSHSFLCLSILLLVLINAAQDALAKIPSAASGLGWMLVAVGAWIPIYLFAMQKRIYQQGWFFTSLKFFLIGICYIFLLSFGMVGASLASLIVL